MKSINIGELYNKIHYNPITGILTWAVKPSGNVSKGDEAGYISSGYRKIEINYTAIPAHRIAYAMYYGYWPKGKIDHINHKTDDNRITNIRCVSNQDNGRNQKLSKINKLGIAGVYYVKRSGSYSAQIRVDRKLHHLIQTRDFFEACCRRRSAEVKYGFHENHGKRYD